MNSYAEKVREVERVLPSLTEDARDQRIDNWQQRFGDRWFEVIRTVPAGSTVEAVERQLCAHTGEASIESPKANGHDSSAQLSADDPEVGDACEPGGEEEARAEARRARGNGAWPGGSAPSRQFTTTSWFFLDGVDVVAPADTVVVCAFGDSITDGITPFAPPHHH
jgi:hypothetical protein